jgi:hypothetical protein
MWGETAKLEPERKGCAQRIRLADEYTRCLRELLDAVAAATASAGNTVFRGRWLETEQKRAACDKALVALEEHRLQHGC